MIRIPQPKTFTPAEKEEFKQALKLVDHLEKEVNKLASTGEDVTEQREKIKKYRKAYNALIDNY